MSSHNRLIISLGLLIGSISASGIAGYSIYTTHIKTSDTADTGFSLVLPTVKPNSDVELNNKEMDPTQVWIENGNDVSPTQTAIGGRPNLIQTPELQAPTPAINEPTPTQFPTQIPLEPTQAPATQVSPTQAPTPTITPTPTAEPTPTPPTATDSAQLAG